MELPLEMALDAHETIVGRVCLDAVMSACPSVLPHATTYTVERKEKQQRSKMLENKERARHNKLSINDG